MEFIGSNIKFLAQEKPLQTTELYKANDCYGHAYVLKKYAGVEQNYQIKGVIEHSAMAYDHVWSFDIAVPLPAMFCFSDYRFPFIRQLTNKALFAIGPSIHYAKSNFTDEDIENLRKQLGKTLLVFLPHSNRSLLVEFDPQKTISIIKRFEKEFDNIIVCLGWREVLRDMEKPYIAEGYTCVTAGHAYDFRFLERLKSIILLSSHSMSFSFGTHVGFCIYLRKPHWIVKGLSYRINAPAHVKKTATYKGAAIPEVAKKMTDYFLKLFKEPTDSITSEQKKAVELIWGFSHIKTPDEIRELFQITEDMFKSRYMPCDRKNPLILCQVFDYLDKGEVKKSRCLLKYVKKMKFDFKWISLIEAILYLKERRLDKVDGIIKKLEKNKGFVGQKIRALKETIESEKKDLDLSIKDEIISMYPKPDFFGFRGINLPWRQ